MKLRPYRVFDKLSKKMLYPKDISDMGILMAPDGSLVRYYGGAFYQLENCVPLYATGMVAKGGTQVWEADIVECDIPHDFGGIMSFTKGRGIVLWDEQFARWYVKLAQKPLNEGASQVMNMDVIGNIYLNKDLIQHEKSN